MGITTSTNGVDAAGDLFTYAMGGVSVIDKGFNIVNGNYQQVVAGDQITLAGVWQFANGSGQLQATGPAQYRIVTIGGAPTATPVASNLPISTSVVGIDQSGNPVIYTPPNATPVPIGSSVSNSAWVPVIEGGTLPNTPPLIIIEVDAGAPPFQAMNLVLIRPVTITPA